MSNTYSSDGSSTASYVLKVTPEVLSQKAEVVEEKISAMQTAFTNMMDTIQNSGSYWIGDAGDTHRTVYKSYETDINDILSRFLEHVTDLNSMAGVYSDVEKTVTETSSNLPSDLIE